MKYNVVELPVPRYSEHTNGVLVTQRVTRGGIKGGRRQEGEWIWLPQL